MMKRYECTLCVYIYNPVKGDPDNGIEPGTAFEDLPEEWLCPECSATKAEFVDLAE
jgi:rubredoxin